MINNYYNPEKLLENIKEDFIEDVIASLPLNTFDDLLNQAQYCFPIISELTINSFDKIDSIEWNTIQNIMYKLNLYMFHNSLDLQMHGNLNRLIARSIIYHIQCDFQETKYINKEYFSVKHFISDIENLMDTHPAIIQIINDHNKKEKINNKNIEAVYYLSYFFISKAEKFISLYTPSIHSIQIKGECDRVIKHFNKKNYINYTISNGKILYFLNEIIRLTMFSRNTFAVGALYFLKKCKEYHKLKVYSVDTLSKDRIKDIFFGKNDQKELVNLQMDQKDFNRIYNGLKQILDSYQIFDQELYIIRKKG